MSKFIRTPELKIRTSAIVCIAKGTDSNKDSTLIRIFVNGVKDCFYLWNDSIRERDETYLQIEKAIEEEEEKE